MAIRTNMANFALPSAQEARITSTLLRNLTPLDAGSPALSSAISAAGSAAFTPITDTPIVSTSFQPLQPMQPTQPLQPLQPIQPVQPLQPLQPVMPVRPLRPLGPVTINPDILGTLFPTQVDKTTTQIANAALQQLQNVSADVLNRAIITLRNNNNSPETLMQFLERRVRVGEVLNMLARTWSPETQQDFREAFQMPNADFDVMDSIVSIAVLNDPDLDEELRAENITQGTEADLVQNRRIVWQSVAPGTPLRPPYLILVAVERQDYSNAEAVINSIIGNLVNAQGFKLPPAAAAKVR